MIQLLVPIVIAKQELPLPFLFLFFTDQMLFRAWLLNAGAVFPNIMDNVQYSIIFLLKIKSQLN